MKTQHLFSAGVLLALGVACGVEVGIDGKACPCETSAGYVCDTAKNVCVHPEQLTVAPPPPPAACDPCTCEKDADCKEKDPTRPACGPSHVCVQCVPGADDKCPAGTYCNLKNQCTIGCRSNDDCAKLSATSPFCQLDRHQCVTCLTSDSCGGKTCTPSGTCATSCTGKPQCAGGQDCCGGLCIDVATDVLNCGQCTHACTADNGTPSCESGVCNAKCADGYATCPGGTGTCLTQIRNDPNNCGACGTVCPTGPNVVSTSCALGKCVDKCADGWLNQNGDVTDGCELACGQKNGDPCCPGNTCIGANLTCRNAKCSPGAG